MHNFEYHNGLWCHDHQVVVPRPVLQNEVILLVHDTLYVGHFSVAKTIELVKRYFWWPQMYTHIKEYVTKGDTCQRKKYG